MMSDGVLQGVSDSRRFEAVLFDLDGTVIDTYNMILASFRKATKQVLGFTPPEDLMMDMVGIPLTEQMARISPEHADELVNVYRENNLRIHDEMVRAFPGTDAALASLSREGLRLAIVTSKRNSLAERGLKVFGFERYFELLIGADDTDVHKPNPAPLLLAADRLGIAATRCVYVGDSPYDMQAAVAAQMPAVAALWGMFTRQRLLDAGAEYLAPSMAELPAVLSVVGVVLT
ncbi:MAG: HAD-IA family hydrolase [Coriobacteriales bacterium]|jgi:pyrophosphatase PpaX|nr:HAD-IA family hydrolase [Coriobacteriales bacterium]